MKLYLVDKKILSIPVIVWLLTLLFMARIILFVNSNGGVEHDSGWYLGVAKNLAMRGIWASYTNTIREETPGAHPSIHGRFSVQDNNGYIYFPAGVTVGPGYIIPEALILKLFGNGWWQYRAWPLIAFAGLLLLIFSLVLEIGGMISLAILSIWLWLIPQYYIGYSFESYAEDIATLFLLLSFVFYYLAKDKKREIIFLAISGLSLSFSILSKTLFLLPAGAFSLAFLNEAKKCLKGKLNIKHFFVRLVVFGAFTAIPLLLFHVYQNAYLASHFGISGIQAVNQDYQLHFQSNGSGLGSINFATMDWSFVLKKINVWLDVGTEALPIWMLLCISPFILYQFMQKKFRILFTLFYGAMILSFLWYIFISTDGWARHAWQGILIGMIIVSITGQFVLENIIQNFRKNLYKIAIFIIFILAIIQLPMTTTNFFLNKQNIEQWKTNRYVHGIEGFPSTPILSLSDQKEVVEYFKNNIHQEDYIYYAGWFIHPEIAALTDKVFYTLDRYFTRGEQNPLGGKSYIIFGPYQQGEWSIMPADYISRKINELCKNIVFQNPSYILCTLQTNLVYNNPAYN